MDNNEPKDHFSIGSALHEMVLHPHSFKYNYVVMPKFDRRSTKGKEAYNEFLENAQGKTLLKEQDMSMIQMMAENMLNHQT